MKSMNHRGVRFIGALAVLAATTIAGSAGARTLTGYGAFRPWPNPGAQDCVNEDWGAAYSTCTALQTMVFEGPVDSGNTNHTITAWSYVNGSPTALGFSCRAQSIPAPGGPAPGNTQWGYEVSPEQTFNPTPQEALSFTVYVPNGWSLRLACTNVSNTQGIASIDYNP